MLIIDDQHRYFWNERRVPSVTQVIRLLAPRTFEVDDYYKNRGIIIHTICHWEDTNELDESSVDELLIGWLRAWRKFKSDTGFIITRAEHSLYHPKYGYAGRIDRYGMLNESLVVVDLKTGQPHPSDLLQAPSYLFLLRANKIKCEKAFDLYLKSNGKYRLEEVKNPTEKFLQFQNGIKKWRENNGNM